MGKATGFMSALSHNPHKRRPEPGEIVQRNQAAENALALASNN